MSLEEVQPGMRGEWHTVVEGTEIRSFELEILGVAPNYVGPREPVILARVLDEANILSGPVAGMSGSPVFVDGRLLGAYAYGYSWSKEQAIVGITPMERMWPLLGDGSSGMGGVGGSVSMPGGRSSGGAPVPEGQSLEPLPSPLVFSGLSPRTWSVFRDELEGWGLQPMLAPSGEARLPEDFQLEAGSAVAAVLMRGDFSAAATGTITWSDGERVLGFGHPFLQLGGVELPMAGAHIFTVVRNMRLSFKLAKPGPILGTVYNDRLSGIAGRVGEVPTMAALRIDVIHGLHGQSEFEAEVFPHPQLVPTMMAIALLEALTRTMEAHPEQSFRIGHQIRVSGFERPVGWRTTVSGFDAAVSLALDLRHQLNVLLNNSHDEVSLEELVSRIEVVDERQMKRLLGMELDRRRYQPGDTVEATVRLQSWRGGESIRRVRMVIPENLTTEGAYRLVMADAATANQFDQHRSTRIFSLSGLIHQMETRRDPGQMYLLLLENRRGLRHGDQTLVALPPSVQQRMTSGSFSVEQSSTEWEIIAETAIPLDGVFTGNSAIDLDFRTSEVSIRHRTSDTSDIFPSPLP